MFLTSAISPALVIAAYALILGCARIAERWIPAIARVADECDARPERSRSIDGLRGYLAFGVFLHHSAITFAYLRTGVWDVPPTNLFVHLGQSSVALFFMVTAFLFWSRLLDKYIAWPDFFIGRVFRIYPLATAVIAAATLIAFGRTGFHLNESIGALVRDVARWFLFSCRDINGAPASSLTVAGAMWTLPYELLFYAALPALALLRLRRPASLWSIIWPVALFALVLFVGRGLSLPAAAAFVGGFIAAHARRSAVVQRFCQGRVAAAVATVVVVSVFLFTSTARAPVPLALLSVFFVIVACGNDLFGVLRWRAARWLGEISYSIYLLHGIVLWIGLQWLVPLAFGSVSAGVHELVVLGLAVVVFALSSFVHLFVERPGIELGRRVMAFRRERAAAAARAAVIASSP